jgi:hypothetical protein
VRTIVRSAAQTRSGAGAENERASTFGADDISLRLLAIARKRRFAFPRRPSSLGGPLLSRDAETLRDLGGGATFAKQSDGVLPCGRPRSTRGVVASRAAAAA